jgi:hypothetical protein
MKMRRREFIIGLIGAMTAWPSIWPSIARAQSPGGEKKQPLSLSAAQQSEIWRAFGTRARKTQEPAGLNVGEAVPDTMNVLRFNRRLRQKIPSIGPYRYALLHGQVLIVDPKTKQIISIIGP